MSIVRREFNPWDLYLLVLCNKIVDNTVGAGAILILHSHDDSNIDFKNEKVKKSFNLLEKGESESLYRYKLNQKIGARSRLRGST